MSLVSPLLLGNMLAKACSVIMGGTRVRTYIPAVGLKQVQYLEPSKAVLDLPNAAMSESGNCRRTSEKRQEPTLASNPKSDLH